MQVVVTVDMGDDERVYWRQAARRIDFAMSRATTQLGYELRREITGKQGLSMYGRHKAWRVSKNGEMVWNYPNPATGLPWSPAGMKGSTESTPPTQVTTKLRTTTTADSTVRKGFGSYEKFVGPTVVYARVQDEGNPNNRNPRTGRTNPIPARPYMLPALTRVEQNGKVEQFFLAEIAKALP
jgi:hypothetical protein